MIASGAKSPPRRGRSPSAGATTTIPTNTSAYPTCEVIRCLPDVPPLEDDGNNFTLWKFRVEMVLSLQDLWGVVDGMDEMPDATTDPKGFAEWKSRDLKARAQITLALKDEPLKSVLDATTARECWKRVSDYCKRIAKHQMVILAQKLFQTILSDSKELEPQIQELLWAARMLSNAGLGFQDNLIAMAIIMSLPPSLSTLRTILSYTEESELSSQYVLSKVIVDEQRRIRNSCVDATVYFANAARKGKGKRKGKNK
jgi:gag-polypeptide of LTR copia-type